MKNINVIKPEDIEEPTPQRVSRNPLLDYGGKDMLFLPTSKKIAVRELYTMGVRKSDIAYYFWSLSDTFECPSCYLSVCDVSGENQGLKCWEQQIDEYLLDKNIYKDKHGVHKFRTRYGIKHCVMQKNVLASYCKAE